MRLASGMSRTIDRRRPRHLSAAQRAEVDHHPEVRLLHQKQRKIWKLIKDNYGSIRSTKGLSVYYEYQKACRDYRNRKRRQEKALLEEVKARYKREQPVIDIQQQLKGVPLAIEKRTKAKFYVFPERGRVIDALFTFATSSPDEECKARVNAINALTALCKLQETRHTFRQKSSSTNVKLEENTSSSFILDPSSLSNTLSIECKSTQCIFCLGCEGLSVATRLKSFHSPGDLKKHFHRKHLQHHPKYQSIDCPHPRCKVTLDNIELLQNHAEVVHKTRT